jgi:hypothetical protein
MAYHALRIIAFIQRLKLFGISEIANIIKVLITYTEINIMKRTILIALVVVLALLAMTIVVAAGGGAAYAF